MCFHLVIGLVSRCCQKTRPGHDHEERWNLRVMCISAFIFGVIFILLIGLSLFLEWGRELGWSGFKSLTRLQTAIPLIILLAIVLVIVIELIVMYWTICSLMQSARVSLHGSDDIVVTDEHEMLETGPNRKRSNGAPIYTIEDEEEAGREEDDELSAVDDGDDDEEKAAGEGVMSNGTTLHRVRKPATDPSQDVDTDK